MNNFFKSFLLLFAASSAFLIGYYLGGEKVKSTVPDFQGD